MDRKDTLPKLTKEDKELIKLFQSEVEKINTLYVKAINSNDISKANQLLKKIRRINDHLSQAYGERAEVRIPQEYAKWSGYIDDILGMDSENSLEAILSSTAKINSYIDELWPIHTEAVNALLDNSKNYVKSSLDWMERQALTMLNQLQQEQVRTQLAKWIISWDSSYGRNQSLREYFLENGITWFKDRWWKYRSIDRYVDMLTRTETAIANTQWTINRALELWITQFEIIESPDCCQECAEMNWDIVDIRDWVVELPPFHPNCRWYIVAILEDDEWNKTELDMREEESSNETLTPEERLKRNLEIIENSTRNLNYEQGAILDDDWNVLRMYVWNEHSVQMNVFGIDMPYTSTHNHPSWGSFSKNDLDSWVGWDFEFWMRASGKFWTYYVYSENQDDKIAFVDNYYSQEEEIMENISKDFNENLFTWKDWENAFITIKDWSTYWKLVSEKYHTDEYNQFMNDHYWKYYREALEKATEGTWVTFEFIPAESVEKSTELNKQYLEEVEKLRKKKRETGRNFEDYPDIFSF